MEFSISEKMQIILRMIDTFMKEEVFPFENSFFNQSFKDLLPELEKKRDKVRKMGLWGPNYPEELGGMGLNLVEHGLVYIVLILTYSNGFGVYFNQLGQRIHQSATDGNRSANGNVFGRKLFASDIRSGVDGSSLFGNHEDRNAF